VNTWYYYWLTNIENIGHVKTKKLLNTFNGPKNIYDADYSDYAKLPYLQDGDARLIAESKDFNRISNEINKIKDKQIEIISIESDQYPELLSHIYHPPYILYKKGKLNTSMPCIGVVGSRKCSEYGYTMAKEIAKGLTKAGVMVVSGLARGIDAAAHIGALEVGGTIAVLANGVNKYYPASNRRLQREIEENGCILSEYPVDTDPVPGFFPARNRIISGMSRGVLVVEAAERSGSLITADFALEQGRDVFAVPANAWSKMSVGSNKLIQAGGKLVMDENDIIEEIQEYLPVNTKKFKDNNENIHINRLAQDEIMVYACLSQEPLYIDDINNKLKMPIATLQHIITSLELKGLIKRIPGQRLVKT